MSPITPCLWFDVQAEAAVECYTSVFPNSRTIHVYRHTEAGHEIHGKQSGSVMSIEFELNGQPFTAINGGPMFQFTEAISFQIPCDTPDEVDNYWGKLSEGGDEQAQQCGWLKDKFGVSWQVVPKLLLELLQDPDPEKVRVVTEAMLQMKKIDSQALQAAYDGVAQ